MKALPRIDLEMTQQANQIITPSPTKKVLPRTTSVQSGLQLYRQQQHENLYRKNLNSPSRPKDQKMQEES